MLNIGYNAEFTEISIRIYSSRCTENNLNAVLHFFINKELQLHNENCILGVQEDLQVEFLSCDKLNKAPYHIISALARRITHEGIHLPATAG